MLNGIRMKERLFYIVAAILESNPATSAKRQNVHFEFHSSNPIPGFVS